MLVQASTAREFDLVFKTSSECVKVHILKIVLDKNELLKA
jgi:hypothetical protein